MLCMPATELAVKEGGNSQTTYNVREMETKKRRATECITAWFNEAGIPFNTVCLESFKMPLDSVALVYGDPLWMSLMGHYCRVKF